MSPAKTDTTGSSPSSTQSLNPLEKYLVNLLEQQEQLAPTQDPYGPGRPTGRQSLRPGANASRPATENQLSSFGLDSVTASDSGWFNDSSDDFVLAEFSESLPDWSLAPAQNTSSVSLAQGLQSATEPLPSAPSMVVSPAPPTSAQVAASHPASKTPMDSFLNAMLRVDLTNAWLSRLSSCATTRAVLDHIAPLLDRAQQDELSSPATQASASPPTSLPPLFAPRGTTQSPVPPLTPPVIVACVQQCHKLTRLDLALALLQQIRRLGLATYLRVINTEVYNALLSALWDARARPNATALPPYPLSAVDIVIRFLREMAMHGVEANSLTANIVRQAIYDIGVEELDSTVATRLQRSVMAAFAALSRGR
ncbi:hypothetical protein H4R35_002021 [Dimargaris xerosporica]|nr:hypothetical protein H4R35_002021 [Dimargaris xerosporica]